MNIRIVIAEDQSLLRGALATLLDLEEDIEVIAEANDGQEALQLVEKFKPDVLVTDIEMPNMSGIDVAERILKLKIETQVLIVTTFARPGYLDRARQAGVIGYLLKDSSSEELAAAVRTVAKGKSAIAAELLTTSWNHSDPLSERERQILRLVEAGNTNKQIAETLNLTNGTIRNYLAEAAAKLNANNRIEAFQIARENGWL